MADHANSSDPAVQRQLDRLTMLSPGADVLGLGRITALLSRVGDPHLRLPPVFHVAGTNGKGSTCAFLRAAMEAAGYKVHVYSSPHLVRFNERIRVAGELIEDSTLAPLLEEVLTAGGDIGASFFEVTTAAACLAFARTPADACIIEVGLGGRLDATNVIPTVATAIAQLGVDHQAFLGDTAEAIAAEKAGIAKADVPMVTMAYDEPVALTVAAVAATQGAPLFSAGEAWNMTVVGDKLHYRDADGIVETPLPAALAGPHQPSNLALAIAMLRHQSVLPLPDTAYAQAAANAKWPARMQRLSAGPLVALLPEGGEIWLDGGHNEAAAAAVSATLAQVAKGRPVHLVLGMLSNKDARGLLAPFGALGASLCAVPIPGHDHHAPAILAEIAVSLGIAKVSVASSVADAVQAIGLAEEAPLVLILGSLYLAGVVLAANDELPT